MDYDAHTTAVDREAAALAVALEGALTVEVPSCPGWSLRTLAEHQGGLFVAWTERLRAGTGRSGPGADDPPADDGELASWFSAVTARLVDELSATPPDTPIWTWVDWDDTARFCARRMAHEVAIHRFDAQLARGTGEPIEPELAADGIDELLQLLTTRERSGRPAGETVHLHATDASEEWLILLDGAELEVRREHAKGDLALRGSVSDLELLLYRRPPVGEIERFGDGAVLELLLDDFRF